MMMPVRCFTCGKVVSHLWEDFRRRVDEGVEPGIALDELGVKRYCCRQVFLSNVDLIKEVDKFKR